MISNRMMEAQEIGDEFRAKAEEIGVSKDVIYCFMAGMMAVEILQLREKLAMSQRAYQESAGAL